MNTLFATTENYLEYCKTQKRLDNKTIKAYRTDLIQFVSFFNNSSIHTISITDLEKIYWISASKLQTQNSKKKACFDKSFLSLSRI